MAMEAGAMPGGAIPPSPFRHPAPPLHSPSLAASPLGPPAHPPFLFDYDGARRPVIWSRIQWPASMWRSRRPALFVSSCRPVGKRKKQSGEACREPQRSGDARGKRKVTSEARVEQRDSSEAPRAAFQRPARSVRSSRRPASINEEQPASGNVREEQPDQPASDVCRHPRNERQGQAVISSCGSTNP